VRAELLVDLEVRPFVEEMQIVVVQKRESRLRKLRRLPRRRPAGTRAIDPLLFLLGDLAPPGRAFGAAFASRTGAERF
jgi:hypothetical protein